MNAPKIPLLSLLLLISSLACAQEWPVYGGDNGNRKFSPLDQINAGNVASLRAAWSWDSVDNATVAANQAGGNATAVPAAYKGTPIVVDGVMYLSTSFGRIVALDPVSGAQRWVFDTRAWEAGNPMNLGYNTRGVAYWEKGDKKRLFFPTYDAWQVGS